MLSSERTMLEWMHTAAMLAALGVATWKASLSEGAHLGWGLLDTSSPQSSALGLFGLFFVFIGVAFAWYGAFAHVSRLAWLEKKKHLDRIFNSRLAPTIFAALR